MDKCCCGNILSIYCIDKKCAKCCCNPECERHIRPKSIVNTDNDIDYQDVDTLKEIYCVFRNILPQDMVNCVIDYIDERVTCSICKMKFTFDSSYQCDD